MGRDTMENALLGMSIVTWIIGAGMLGVGIYLVVDGGVFDQTEILDPSQQGAPPMWAAAVYIMLATGALTFAIGFVGWIGTLFENRYCLLAYVIVSSVTMATMAAGGALGVFYMVEVNNDNVVTEMQDHLINEYSEMYDNNTYYDAWTMFQIENECCGAANYTDWLLNPEFSPVVPVPVSCCNVENATDLQLCYDEVNTPPAEFVYLYDQPCAEAFSNDMTIYSVIVYGITFASLAFSLVSTALAGVMYSDYKKNKVMP